MKLSKSFLKTISVVFVGLAMLMAPTTPVAFAGVEVGDGLTLNGSVRYRMETDQDDARDKDRWRDRIRLRFGGAYSANDMVSMGFRLETGSDSLQSPHETLGIVPSNGKDFALSQAYMVIKAGPATFLLGKWGSPLFNPNEFVHDADINFEGLGMAIGGGDDIKYTLLLARHFLNQVAWNDTDHNTVITAQFIVSGGSDTSWTVALGTNRTTLNAELGTSDILADSVESNWNYAVAEIRLKEINDLRLGGGYQTYDGDVETVGDVKLEDDDKTGFMVFARVKAGPVGLRLSYWDVGYASMFWFGAAAQDNSPYSTNMTLIWAQIDMPKIHDAVKWDIRYYSQDPKNKDIADGGAVMGGDHTRTRVQVNFNVGF